MSKQHDDMKSSMENNTLIQSLTKRIAKKD